jgi:uncharacterized repeat protein (TIGR01451 family)/LPXTG-motif cell wall-anchored protein
MKKFSPKNKIYGLVKFLTVTITIVSTVGFSPFSVTLSSVSAPAVPIAQARGEQKVCNLTLTKTDSIDPVKPGDELVYHLTLKNIGNGDCTGTGVLIKDVFDPNTTYVSSSKTPAETTSEYIKWNFGTVTPGEIENVDLTMLVSQGAQCGSVLINKAKFWSTQTNWGNFVTQETSVVCPPQPFCGDGNLDQGEECEIGHECECGDGSTCNTQTCLCEQVPPEPSCGDGIKNQLTEQCDGTDWVGAHQSCTQDCHLINLPWCGDGIKNNNEECDGTDGVLANQTCTSNCTIVNSPPTPTSGTCYQCTAFPDVTADSTWTTNGDGTITIRTALSTNFVDNTYGINAIGWPNGHKFSDLTGSDKLTLALYDATNVKRMEFQIDYLTASSGAPSGYKTLCVNGGDGKMITGKATDVIGCLTSLDVNFNTSGYVLTTNSPATDANYTPNLTYSNWIYKVWYEVIVKPEPFAAGGGFGKPMITNIHASPSKKGTNTCPTVEVSCPTTPICGDGIKNQLTEQCDGTDWVGAHQSCTQDCHLINLPWCGDGVKNDAEECDGTSGVGEHQACTAQCTIVNLNWCGDGVKNGDEQCDGTDGVSEHYSCTDTCTLEYVPYCGDNIVQGSEQCDDGNIIDGDGCTANCTIELSVCDINVELAKNGGFESPLIADSQSWNIYSNSQISGWKIEWVSLTPSEFGGYSRPINANLELQNSNVGWDPQEGNQYAELDSDWDGPSGSLNGEPASVKIYQDIPTIIGATYHIGFWFSPRPNTTLDNNRLQFKWDGEVKDTLEAAGENNTTWVKHEYTFTASGTLTRLYFTDLGLANSEGTFLDNVSVKCVPPQEPICGDNAKNQLSEECDGTDGVGAHQSCSQDCKLINIPWCGDGIKNLIEQCDGIDGITNHYTCTAQCTLQYIPYCGDNLVNQTSEQCDGTTGVGLNQACTSQCTLINIPTCGNGIKEGQEQCDGTDGIIEHNICTAQCTLQYIPYCGDNLVNQTSEQCDDGNLLNGDGCSLTCQLEQNEPSCGNGIIETGEACDNASSNGISCEPGCSNTCSYCTLQCTVATNTGGTCGGGGGGGGGDSYYPALAISKFVIEDIANPGETLHYTIVLKNNGNAPANNVKLTDTLPTGFTFSDTGLATKEWDLGNMAMGVEKITNYEVLVGQGVVPGDYKNIAAAQATNQGVIYAKALTVILGQVLGARVELPNTGTDPILFIIVGLGIIITSLLALLYFQRKIKLINNN